MGKFKALFVLALALGVAAPAFAETQNVKVSGSIDAYAFARSNYDLVDGNDQGVVAAGTAITGGTTGSATQRSEGDTFFMSQTQLEVSADLTDNVSTVVNVINQRDWNSATTNVDEFDISVDLAYVQMKEIFYSPLTLTIGRQDIWFGRGFLIGNNNTAWDPQASIQANEYSVTTAFDALRATLDFNPWTVDLVYSKINEGADNPEDDTDLYIANVNYKFAEYNAVAEGYYILNADRNTLASAAGTRDNLTNTIGARAQFDPIAQITLGAELAHQFGDYFATLGGSERDLSAWGLDIFGTYRWVDYAWKPELTLEYVSFSGDAGVSTTEGYHGWNSLYRGKFWTAYADFREFQYSTGDVLGATGVDQSATTNQEFLQAKVGMKPLEDLMLEAAWTYLWNEESITGRNEEIGTELDLQATYDYTEDVSFNLLTGWFFPGDFYFNSDEVATDIVSSVKVTF
jgi:hypothetical protein